MPSYNCKALCINTNCKFFHPSFSLVHFKKGPEILQGKLLRCLFLWSYFCHWVWFCEFSCSSEIVLSCFYFHLCLLKSVYLYYSQVFIDFFFSKCLDSFLIGQFHSFHCFYFSLFNYKYGTFFNSYIFAVDSNSLYKGFWFLVNILISSRYMMWVIFSCNFVNL